MRDMDIREALYQGTLNHYIEDPYSIVVEELGIAQGTARIDIAVVNGLLIGYELKSERDNLTRLPRQIELYNKVFDKVTLVVSESHLDNALKEIPQWWGVMVAKSSPSAKIDLVPFRGDSLNQQVSARYIAELLWRDEVLELLEDREAAYGYRSKPRRVLWDRLCEVYDCDEIRDIVRTRLKSRSKLTKRSIGQAVQSLM